MLEFFDASIMMYALVSFLLGAVTMLIYYKIKSQFKASRLANIEVIDTITNQYKRRLDQYEGIINELKIKTELLESKMNDKLDNKTTNHALYDSTSQQTSQHSKEQNEFLASSDVIIGSNDVKMAVSDEYLHTGDTSEFILKLLSNGPLTSREIQTVIRRTREHTSRIMKKLYELKYVDRDINHKPFRYNITDLGRLKTHDHASSNDKSMVSVQD